MVVVMRVIPEEAARGQFPFITDATAERPGRVVSVVIVPWGAIYAELGIDIVHPTPDVRTLLLRARLAFVYHLKV